MSTLLLLLVIGAAIGYFAMPQYFKPPVDFVVAKAREFTLAMAERFRKK